MVAVEPDPLMRAVLTRVTARLPVTVVGSTHGALPPEAMEPPVDLLYAAAAWHWSDPATRVGPRRVHGERPMTADDFVGLLSTVSAYLSLPGSDRILLFARIRQPLPDDLEVRRDLVVHRARRTG